MVIAETMGLAASAIKADRRLYHASDEVLMTVVRGLDNALESVALFGHNPGLTEFANRLTSRPISDNIPTCGVVALTLPVTSWKDAAWVSARLVFLDYPKKRNES